MYFPSKFGEPDRIIKPTNAITIPKIFFKWGFSFKNRYAIKTPKGTSHWTKRTADEASIMFNPENVKEYWIVHAIIETKNILTK